MAGDDFAAGTARLAGVAGLLLGWTPDAFWRATPAELRSALEALAEPRAAPLGRDEIERLMARFPD